MLHVRTDEGSEGKKEVRSISHNLSCDTYALYSSQFTVMSSTYVPHIHTHYVTLTVFIVCIISSVMRQNKQERC